MAEDVPAGGRVAVLCSGKGCGFKRRAVAVHGGKAFLTKLFRGHRLKPHAVIDVRVTAPGMVGRAARFTIRANKLPRKTVAARLRLSCSTCSRAGPCRRASAAILVPCRMRPRETWSNVISTTSSGRRAIHSSSRPVVQRDGSPDAALAGLVGRELGRRARASPWP